MRAAAQLPAERRFVAWSSPWAWCTTASRVILRVGYAVRAGVVTTSSVAVSVGVSVRDLLRTSRPR